MSTIKDESLTVSCPDTFERIDDLTKIDGPHGWIQWKGTDVCIDLRCPCGGDWHLDQDFLYYTKCPQCEQAYAVGAYVRLVPIDSKIEE